VEAVLARIVHVTIAVGGAYYLALWFALVVWTFRDIQARSRSVIAQIFSTLVVVLFSVPGVFLYLLLRPRETLEEAFERSLQEEYVLQDLEGAGMCPECRQLVDDEFVYCPYCRTQLRHSCLECGRAVDVRWVVCPYCGTEQPTEEPLAAPAHGWALPDLSRLARGLRRGAATGMLAADAVESDAPPTIRVGSPHARPQFQPGGASASPIEATPVPPLATAEETNELPSSHRRR
jgi:RNA polymerase subunit RPABC4/transcription elongation factor Spt4